MIQKEIYQFSDNFKYFTEILALCFNCKILSLQSVRSVSIWLNPPPPKCADIILEHSLTGQTKDDTKYQSGREEFWAKLTDDKQVKMFEVCIFAFKYN